MEARKVQPRDNIRVLHPRQEQPAPRRSKRHRHPTKRFFAVLIAIGLAYAGYIVISQEIGMAEMRKAKAQLEEQIKAVQQQDEDINSAIENTKTNEYIENTAREKLGLVKEGEIKFVEKD